ncbi:MAG: hypothetical protein IT236_09170 [Bacteroidia bacterium]|nr:hypothetical protein [Bacteroidia bacterium]
MDWWYKCENTAVTAETVFKLQDAIKTVLREGKSLASVCLFDDAQFFFIKTNHRFALNYFLSQNGFEEIDDDEVPKTPLTLHYGTA